jgi:hypothetical protein
MGKKRKPDAVASGGATLVVSISHFFKNTLSLFFA